LFSFKNKDFVNLVFSCQRAEKNLFEETLSKLNIDAKSESFSLGLTSDELILL